MHASRRLGRRISGFTLIELLIVVAIIGILAAIAVPNFINARLRALLSRVFAEHQMLEHALIAYHLDANAYPVDNGTGVIRPPKSTIDFNGIKQTITGIGVLTTPVLLSLSIGLSSVLAGRSAIADGFGLLGLASVGPILFVLLLGWLLQ